MSKMRIYELARELGVDNKAVISCAHRIGMTDKTSHSNSLEDSEADAIRRAFLRQAMGGSTATGTNGDSKSAKDSSNDRKSRVVLKRSGREVLGIRRASSEGTEKKKIIRISANKKDEPSAQQEQSADLASAGEDVTNSLVEEIQSNDGLDLGKEHSPDVTEKQAQEGLDFSTVSVDDSSQETSTTETTVSENTQSASEDSSSDNDETSSSPEEKSESSLESKGAADNQEAELSVKGEESTGGEADSLTSENNLDGQSQGLDSKGDNAIGSQKEVLESKEQFVSEAPSVQIQDKQAEDVKPVEKAKPVSIPGFEFSTGEEVGTMISSPLPKIRKKAKSTGEGPKILGKIQLNERTVARSGRFLDEDEEDDTGSRGGKRRRSKHKRKEFSRKDLLDYNPDDRRKKKKSKGKSSRGTDEAPQPKMEFTGPKASKRVVKLEEFITVGDLARQMSLKAGEVISKLISLGVMATINQTIDKDTAILVADEFEYQVESTAFDETELIKDDEVSVDAEAVFRPPVVTVMGHVDHGKTSLLDSIRNATVADKEHGGITQHIGAYQVTVSDDKKITFIDTPGHEAFTAMRARGAEVTDIVILVVAADDGVMPQTIEAINHSQAAEVPIVVAVNKMDKNSANPDKVKQQLAEHGLQPEDWGGDTMFFPVSAHSGMGINELLEGVLLQAEIIECKAVADGRARGTVIEASQRIGRGTVASVLVQRGSLRLGDIFIAGAQYGRVRSMMNHLGQKIDIATPSTPIEITGFNGVPFAGDDFISVESEADAREITENRSEKIALAERAREGGPITLEEFARRAQEVDVVELNIILKADVHGSVEAVRQALERLPSDKVKVKVLHAAVGGVTESDVQLALASSAIIVGFGVRAEPRALTSAESHGVDVRFYRVIYEVTDDVRAAMVGMLEPDKKEVHLGRADVREVFSVPKLGAIGGCYVSDGIFKRGCHIRVLRDSIVIYEGMIASLRRFKDDVKQVQSGYECGIGVENFSDIKIGDTLESYELEDVAPTID